MKKITILILLLLFCAFSSDAVNIMRTRAGAGETCDDATYFCSDFEDVTDDSQWVQSVAGTWNDDYTTSPAPLEGSESCLWGNSADYRADFGATSDDMIYAMGTIHFIGCTDDYIFITYEQSGGADLGGIRFIPNGDVTSWSPRYYWNGWTTLQSETGIDPAEGETWYWKVEYNNGSGANGIWNFYLVEDSGGFPGWGSARHTVSDANDTAQIERLLLNDQGDAGQTMIIDDIRVHSASMDYP